VYGNLRKAGLGLLTNVPGSNKPVSVVEDTAVAVKYLPDYMRDFGVLLKKYNLSCVYHAHIASGELHLRPVLDLKKEKDVKMFKTISKEVALLVKKYHGSLSGEHGDGRLRGEYIPLMYGDKVYSLMKQMKEVWDKDNIFNYQKIIDTPPMNTSLRYDFSHKDYDFKHTYYSFEKEKGFLCAIEQCNGAAVCRKNTEFLETMCPSFRANNDERYSTRARANMLRELLTYPKKNNPFDNKDIYDVLSSCLSCKGCKRECPSNVDMAKIKSEFFQHYYRVNGVPLNVFLMSYLPLFEKIGSFFPKVYNFFVKNKITSFCVKKMMSFSQQRSLPLLTKHTCKKELSTFIKNSNNKNTENKKTIYIFIDEFTNFQDSKIGICAVKLFISLGYNVKIAPINNSGRILFSKGLVKRAKRLARHNINKMLPLINDSTPLVGIEPSTILSFKDEYPCLTDKNIENLTKNCLCFDEFLSGEIDKGNITSKQFTTETKHLLYHTHCQQKAIVGEKYMQKILSLPTNYTAEGIKSGCCGMAGSFGYEKKHYKDSEEIVHQVIIPKIKSADKDTVIVASGTSCREQINHFANKRPFHPLQILYDAVLEK
jgi:Fe-S oxidoreductase